MALERGLGDFGHVFLPISQHFSELSQPSPKLLTQISFSTPPTIPSLAALFFHQAEQEILSLNDLNGCLLSWLRGQGPSLGRKKMAVWSCGMDSSCSAYLRAQGPLDSLYPAWAFSLSVAGQCLGL